MKVTIEIPEEEIVAQAQRSLKDIYWLRDRVEHKAKLAAAEYADSLDIAGMVRAHIDAKIQSVIENVVAGQVKHIVKLAVDKELAIARELVTP